MVTSFNDIPHSDGEMTTRRCLVRCAHQGLSPLHLFQGVGVRSAEGRLDFPATFTLTFHKLQDQLTQRHMTQKTLSLGFKRGFGVSSEEEHGQLQTHICLGGLGRVRGANNL